MLTPRTTMSYAQWLDKMAAERLARAEGARVPTYAMGEGSGNREQGTGGQREVASVEACRSDDLNAGLELPVEEEECEPAACAPEACAAQSRVKADPWFLPAVEYFQAGRKFSIGDLEICPFTIPHDAADPCGFVFQAEGIRMAIATDLGYVPANVKQALRRIDVLLLESNHDLEMLKDGPYPWSVKQRVLSRVGHLSNAATAEFLERDYDGGAAYIVLAHLSEANNAPELARITAERAIGGRMSLLGNRILLALQGMPLAAIEL